MSNVPRRELPDCFQMSSTKETKPPEKKEEPPVFKWSTWADPTPDQMPRREKTVHKRHSEEDDTHSSRHHHHHKHQKQENHKSRNEKSDSNETQEMSDVPRRAKETRRELPDCFQMNPPKETKPLKKKEEPPVFKWSSWDDPTPDQMSRTEKTVHKKRRSEDDTHRSRHHHHKRQEQESRSSFHSPCGHSPSSSFDSTGSFKTPSPVNYQEARHRIRKNSTVSSSSSESSPESGPVQARRDSRRDSRASRYSPYEPNPSHVLAVRRGTARLHQIEAVRNPQREQEWQAELGKYKKKRQKMKAISFKEKAKISDFIAVNEWPKGSVDVHVNAEIIGVPTYQLKNQYTRVLNEHKKMGIDIVPKKDPNVKRQRMPPIQPEAKLEINEKLHTGRIPVHGSVDRETLRQTLRNDVRKEQMDYICRKKNR